MKKGLLFIDWSISIAIFIVYLVGLFIYIVPILNQEYTEDYLKTLARTGFEENTYNTVYIYPIFIKPGTSDPNDPIIFEIDPPSNLILESTHASVYDENFQEIEADISDGNSPIYIRITVDPGGEDITKKFYLIISDETYGNTALSSGVTPEQSTIGVPEILTGISKNKIINNLKEEKINNYDYESIKEKLKYPKSKEIAIDIYCNEDIPDLNCLDNQIATDLSIQPSTTTQNDTIYVTEWSAWEINKNSERHPITISILNW